MAAEDIVMTPVTEEQQGVLEDSNDRSSASVAPRLALAASSASAEGPTSTDAGPCPALSGVPLAEAAETGDPSSSNWSQQRYLSRRS